MSDFKNLPYPKLPVGIGHSRWFYDGEYAHIKFMMFNGFDFLSIAESISRSFVDFEGNSETTMHVIQMMADKAVIQLLDNDELKLSQRIKARLESVLHTMKVRAKMCMSLETRFELNFFANFMNSYVLENPETENEE
jgi:hypothetical protein